MVRSRKYPITHTRKYPQSPVMRHESRFTWVLGYLGPWVLLVLVTFLAPLPSNAGNWPQWRGPDGTGVTEEKHLPIIWNEGRNLRWKCPLPPWGTSTPAIWGDAIFVTAHDADDKLLALRIDKRSGQIVWRKQIGQAEPFRRADRSKRGVQTFHRWHNLASPSPVTDGKYVVVHFGDGLLAALDFDGNIVWKRNLQDDYGAYTVWWGHANSPVLHEGLVISVCMQDSLADRQEEPAASYLVAHDVRDGFEKWKRPRVTKATAEQCDAYTTPLLAKVAGRTKLIVMGGNQLDGYDPATGKQLWFLPGLIGGRTVTGPIIHDDIVYCTRGMRGDMLAVPLGKEGRLDRRDIKWTYETGTPDTCSPVLWHNLLFFISDDGIARCIDAEHGTLHWKRRLKGTYKASPIASEGRIFFLNTDGLCTIVSAAVRYDELTENQLGEGTLASPAVSDGAIFVRGRNYLYCVAKGPQ